MSGTAGAVLARAWRRSPWPTGCFFERAMLPNLDREQSGGVVAEDVDHLDDDPVRPGLGVGMRGPSIEAIVLPCSVRLPLVVERVVGVVPVHGPVVDPLFRVRDSLLHVFRHVVERDD